MHQALYTAAFSLSFTRRGLKGAASAAAMALLVQTASAQAPSFATVPNSFDDTTGYAVSPNGRYVTGGWSFPGIVNSFPYRWDRLTNQYINLGVAEGLGLSGVAVLDDGRVYGNGSRTIFEPGNIFRWTPSTGVFDWAYTPTDPRTNDYLRGVSRDGQYGFGVRMFRDPAGTPMYHPTLYPFWQASGPFVPIDLNMTPGSPSLYTGTAGVSIPVNGTRRVFGTMLFAEGHNGAIWTLGFEQLSRDNAWSSIVDITPRADIVLGTVGTTYIIRGDGPDQTLSAPTAPFFMTSPTVRRISDDGRVAVGWSLIPALSRNDAVVWRKGQPPTVLRSILAGAGVSVPAWNNAVLSGVSADGSTVVGEYSPSSGVSRAFAAVLPALNDNCAGARAITYGTILASTNGATRAGVSGSCASEGTAPDVWFSFTPLANETISIDTCGSSFDTTLAIYQASSCASIGAALACNDDASPACSDNVHASRLSASVFAGQNYFIRVSGWNGAFGTISLTITAPSRPVNDACAQATDVAPGTGAMFNNINAITDSRPGCPGGATPFNDVWFKTVAPESGRMTFSICNATINTVMMVYDGSACSNLSAPSLACGSNNTSCGTGVGSQITVPCTAGQTLLVRVGGLFGSSGSGLFVARFACDQNQYSAYSAAVLNSNPRAYWRFDDSGSVTAADAKRSDPYSCGDYPGEYVGQLSRGNDYHGKSLSLQHSGGYVRAEMATHVSDISICPNGATLEAWVKTTDPLAGVVLTNRNGPGDTSLTLVIGYNTIGVPGTEGKVMFITDGPGVFHGAISGTRIDDGRWHHIIGRRSYLGIPGLYSYQLYIDGAYNGVDNLPGVGSAPSGANGFYWLVGNGTAWPAANAVFSGKIDEVAIYCGLLSDPVMRQHYDIGRPCPTDINLDHVVDFFDYLDFVEAFSAQSFEGDFNRDGVIDFFDYLDFVQSFSAGC